MNLRSPRFRLTDTLVPYTTLFRTGDGWVQNPLHPEHAQRCSSNSHQTKHSQHKGTTTAPRPSNNTTAHVKYLRIHAWKLLLFLPLRFDHGKEDRSEEHTSDLQSLMRISYAVFCLHKKDT